MSDSVWPHRRQPTRLLSPWCSPGKNTGVGCHFLLQCMEVKSESEVTLWCPTLRDPMDAATSSVHGIFQARVVEWAAISSLNSILFNKEGNSKRNLERSHFLCHVTFIWMHILQMVLLYLIYSFNCSKNKILVEFSIILRILKKSFSDIWFTGWNNSLAFNFCHFCVYVFLNVNYLKNIRWFGLCSSSLSSLSGWCSPWGHKESDMIERLNWLSPKHPSPPHFLF